MNYSKCLNDFINVITNAQIDLKDKVEKLEKKLKIDYEKDLIQKFKEKNKRDISIREKEELFRNYAYPKIFFDNLTIDGVLMFLKKSEEQLKKTVENINKIKNKENIDIKEFNNIYNNLKIILNKFDSIYNIYYIFPQFLKIDIISKFL